MKRRLLLSCAVLVLASGTAGQFSVDSFIFDGWDLTVSKMKLIYKDKEFSRTKVMGLDAYACYDWLDPVSIRIAFLFSKDGTLAGKSITNSKYEPEAKEKLTTMLKGVLIRKLGTDFSESSFLWRKVTSWKGDPGFTILLMESGNKTTLVIMKKAK